MAFARLRLAARNLRLATRRLPSSASLLGGLVIGQERLAELRKPPLEDRAARVADQPLVEAHVVHRGEDRRQDLVRREQVVQVGAREAGRARRAVAARVDRVAVAAGGAGWG